MRQQGARQSGAGKANESGAIELTGLVHARARIQEGRPSPMLVNANGNLRVRSSTSARNRSNSSWYFPIVERIAMVNGWTHSMHQAARGLSNHQSKVSAAEALGDKTILPFSYSHQCDECDDKKSTKP
jgi:hypothetical protein